MEAKLRDSVALAKTPGRPVWDLNFAKGATPQYLWVPRVEDDGYKGAPAAKAAAGSASAEGAYVPSSAMKGKSSKEGAAAAVEPVGAHCAVGGMSVHKGAPPEIEFQVRWHCYHALASAVASNIGVMYGDLAAVGLLLWPFFCFGLNYRSFPFLLFFLCFQILSKQFP